MSQIGDLIKQERKAKGLKVYELAQLASVSPEFVTQVEKGRKFPSVATLDKLCVALNKNLKPVYLKEHRPDILAFLDKDIARLNAQMDRSAKKAKKKPRKTK